MTEPTTSSDAAADRVLVIERVFDAPRDLVFRLWTDPRHVRHWFGPRGFTTTHLELDMRPGGRWRACMREDATGTEHWLGGVCRELRPPEHLVFTNRWDREDGTSGPETVVSVTLVDERGKTRMIFRQGVFDTVANRDGHEGGWSSSFDVLEEYLTTLSRGAA